jgi:transposase-like protein
MKLGWVFGGVERGSLKTFMVSVPARNKETLYPLLEKFVARGSTIYSDKFSTYTLLNETLGFEHYTVNHSQHFVDPDTGCHTQLIENSWLHAKRSLPLNGTRSDMLNSYLSTFCWHRQCKALGKDPFVFFLECIKDQYNPTPNQTNDDNATEPVHMALENLPTESNNGTASVPGPHDFIDLVFDENTKLPNDSDDELIPF